MDLSNRSMTKFWNTWQSRVLALLRIIVGFLIFWHGTQKLFGFPPPAQTGRDPLSGLLLIAGILEFAGGAFLMLGLWTRWSAFLLSGMMAVAYWMVFGGKSLLPIVNGGEIAVLYCFVFFYLFFAGGGTWDLDSYIKRRRN
ncbi:MAG: DoxX family protein [Verrucomicrobiota bacterium]